MNFLKRLFFPEKRTTKFHLEWNKHMQIIADSLTDNKLVYPIIMFYHVPWDFQVYDTPNDLIGQSISGHWGLNDYFSKEKDEMELIVDSKGVIYTLSHDHLYEMTKTHFSYPSIFKATESIDDLKTRIINGSTQYISYIDPDAEQEINDKIKTIKQIDSIKELLLFVNKELNL